MKNSELQATFQYESQRWGDSIIAVIQIEKEHFKVKTKAEEGELVEGLTYRFYGHWKTHHKHGRQFEAQSFVKVRPHDEAGTIAYLRRAPWIGPKVAKNLWTAYQGEAVQALRTDPHSVVAKLALRHFQIDRAFEAAAYLESEKANEDATIDLMDLLAGRGFPRTAMKKAIQKWGNRAAQVIRKSPYKLMGIPGCGFMRADQLYLELGHSPARLKRQTLCMWHTMHSDTEGHTWFDPGMLQMALGDKISSADVRAVKAAKLGLRAKLFDIYREPAPTSGRWLTEINRSKVEQEIADRVAMMAALDPAWPGITGLDVSEHQAEQLGKALGARIGLFGGSPGTGKTYSAARLIAKIRECCGADSVAVVAPTGKAAVRISEALQEYGIPMKARTIHSFLGVQKAEDGGAWTFVHNESNPVDERFVVVDESSMVDAPLMACLLRALHEKAHLLLVGDVQQLPPVGYGAPLRDLVAAGIPAGELTEIRRNSGMIVETCARIRDGEHLTIPRRLNLEDGYNLMIKSTPKGPQSLEEITGLIRKIRNDPALGDPVWGTQVIVAVNEKSPLSRAEVNQVLQEELNGSNHRPNSKFWPGDKVVCLKNGFWPVSKDAIDGLEDERDEEEEDGLSRKNEAGDTELYVANGELGRVIEEFPNKTILEFFNPRRVILVPRGEDGAPPFDLGYAITAHKSQGSEWPIVIIAVDDYPGAKMICDRSWIYTAISRAKKACILVGQESVLLAMVGRQKINRRKTFLVERLAAARAIYQKYQKRETEVGGLGSEQEEQLQSEGNRVAG